jgi:hypothetical protein
MNKLAALVLICLVPLPLSASDRFVGLKLIDGYKTKRGQSVDATVWTIYKDGGLIINFEEGMNEGLWADPQDKAKYTWYREQTVNGHRVLLAIVKPGLKTVWEPKQPRSPELGNILLVTFPLGGQPDNTANFKAEILNEKELADALLMILTFEPGKY